ncbi:hypothetical protein [Candidatus Odyssella thessalonicensis]|uniref:hypothetical protein n=1 Tax=Candidatus Odyssella thessalonicensis TaxID=84647 RepID=UPI000225A9B1|nr:hypothetical protein [Candidatus Odyssella thessalonicensis]
MLKLQYGTLLNRIKSLKTKSALLTLASVLSIFALSPSHSSEDWRLLDLSNEQISRDGQEALNVINGVVSMYRQDAQIGHLYFSLRTDSVLDQVNASYSRVNGNRALNFPYIIQSDGWSLYATAHDQGIVAHETGHMVLDYFRPSWLDSQSAHLAAFHEAFADLTTQFYRYHNPASRPKFISELENGQACVGDNEFTCIRNNSARLTLINVQQDERLCESHEFSKTFSSAVYDSMADAFMSSGQRPQRIRALGTIVTWHRTMLIKAVLSLRGSTSLTLMDISLAMLRVSDENPIYKNVLGNSFIKNGFITLIHKSPIYYYQANSQFVPLCQLQDGRIGNA